MRLLCLHACGNWVLKRLAPLAPGNWTNLEFFVLSAVAPPAVFVFYTMNEGEKDASSTFWRVAEQLLALANAGKFFSLLSKKLFVNIVIKWTQSPFD